jgi:hypothetical protein
LLKHNPSFEKSECLKTPKGRIYAKLLTLANKLKNTPKEKAITNEIRNVKLKLKLLKKNKSENINKTKNLE